MDAAPDNRRQLGQLMVDEGLLSAEELAHALQEQSASGKPLGETLVTLGYVSPGAVANALAEQHGGLLRTEFGVSTGLSATVAAESNGLHAAPPVAPLAAASGEHDREHEHGSSAPLGGGLRLTRAPGAPALPEAAPLAPAPVAAASAPVPAAAPVSAEEATAERIKFASLHADLGEARAALEQKSHHLTELTERLDEAVSQLRLSQAARDAFAAKAAELEARSQAPAEPDPAAVARIEELEAQLQATAADRDALTENLSALQEKLAEAEAESSAPAAPDAALVARIEELQAQVVELRQAAAAAEELARAESARGQTFDAELQTLAAGRDALAEQVAALQAQLAEAEQAEAPATPDPALLERVQELEAELAARDRAPVLVQADPHHAARTEKLENTIAELQARLGETAQAREAEVTRASAVAAARVTAVESQLQAAETERNALVQKVEVLQGLFSGTAAAHEAALAQLEEQLADRDRRLAGLSDGTAAIEQEYRAALGRVEQERDALAERFDELQRLLDETTTAHRAAFAKLEEQLVLAEPEESVHVLLVPAPSGYVLLERSGPPPDARAIVEIGEGAWGEGRFVVSRIGPSPLPDGPKHCAFLERA